MTQLVIASRPLIILTLHSYEANYYSLKLASMATTDQEQLRNICDQLGHLEEMIDHCKEILKNL